MGKNVAAADETMKYLFWLSQDVKVEKVPSMRGPSKHGKLLNVVKTIFREKSGSLLKSLHLKTIRFESGEVMVMAAEINKKMIEVDCRIHFSTKTV
jgi:hypothetical protein